MRNSFKTMILLAAISGLASCTEDEDIDFCMQSGNSGNGEVVFNAEYSQPQDESHSKTYISGSSVMFSGSETVAIYTDQSSTASTFSTILSGDGDGSKAQFTGSINTTGVETFYAVMPSSAAQSFSPSEKTFTVKVPGSQAPTANTCDPSAQVMVSSTTKDRMSFYFMNVCTYIKLNITEEVKSITFESLDENDVVSGTAVIDEEGNLKDANGSNKVTLSGSITAGIYYIAILPCELKSGFKLTFKRTDGSEYSKKASKAATFTRAKIKNLGKITPPKYFYIYTTGAATYKLANNGGNNPNIQYAVNSTDDSSFKDFSSYKAKAGETVYFRGLNPDGFSHSESSSRWKDNGKYSTLNISASASAIITMGGNLMSIIDNTGDETTTIPGKYCFYRLFYEQSAITTAPKLPCTVLAEHCYDGMFSGCDKLTAAPDLPATKLVEGCYNGMFHTCSSLKYMSVAFTEWDDNCTQNWVLNFSNKGTFRCPKQLPHEEGFTYFNRHRIPINGISDWWNVETF